MTYFVNLYIKINYVIYNILSNLSAGAPALGEAKGLIMQ